ncbi:GatB/YqeY domain-containing protein [Burkholderia plantarii]|uniref:GatB/YqeY domain-containing protein n=1 Tax=Burkholderia plantarii TaxID=41899 RepID=UPI0018DD9E95|nr:GatB/YqeY domain-containing protein [Burkholderia plantarii]MBI0331750.1 GatB/YqeY domain-containing protein [Burkholderia plantarii]
MSLKDQISEDMKTAMRAKDSLRLGAIRLLLSAIKQREVDERITLDNAGITSIVDKMLKQRKDSISQFQAAGRDDLAAQEQAEMAVLIAYMPAQLSDAEVADAVQEVVVELGASGPQDLGRVMAALKTRLAGKADMTVVAGLAKAALAK